LTKFEHYLGNSNKWHMSPNIFEVVEYPAASSLPLYLDPDVSSLADCIFDCESIEELCIYLNEASTIFSGSYFLLQVIGERSFQEYAQRVVTNYPVDFFNAYVDRNYYFIDPIIEKCRNHCGLFLWDEVSTSSPISRKYQIDAQSIGIGPIGATFVSDDSKGDVCAVSISSQEGARWFRDKFEVKRHDFCNLSNLIIEVFKDLSCTNCSRPTNLTDDQIRVLYDIAHGVSEVELEKKKYLFGSYNNVKQSILRICGTKTLAQATVLAAKLGLLEEVPYTRKDIQFAASSMADCSIGDPTFQQGNNSICTANGKSIEVHVSQT
jgi:hypothetical protein